MKTTAPKRDIDGILLLNKPQGLSSNAALQRTKRLLNARKAGHTGSLDPLATGMLPICFGEATKFSQFLLNADKVYRATARLGIKTDTSDSLGEIVSQTSDFTIHKSDLEMALSQFRGSTSQTPSMYSALKHQGRPLYSYARQGIEIKRKSRIINVHRLELCSFDETSFSFIVHCSKGTYVRNLIEDIGDFLGCGAHMSALHRESCAAFTDTPMYDLNSLENMDLPQLDGCLLPVDAAITYLPLITLDAQSVSHILQGRSLPDLAISQDVLYRLYDTNHVFLGIGVAESNSYLKPQRLIANYPHR